MEDMKGGMNGGKCEHCGGNHAYCGGWGMGMGMGHRHGGGRMLIKIIVALIIFWMGIQYGELKAFAHRGMMGDYGAYGYDAGYGTDNGSYGPGMMYRVITGQSTTTVR